VVPLIYLVVRAGELGIDGIEAIIVRPRTAELVLTTGQVALGVAIITLVLGVGLATIVDRIRLPWPRLWWILLALPVAVPSYVAAFALLALRPETQGVLPTIMVISLTTVPYVALPTLAALNRADHSLADVARSLGASRSRAFLTITLPQVLPAAAAGCLLAVLYALSDFASPSLLRTPTLTVGVYGMFTGSLNRSHAAALGMLLVVLALFFVAVEQRARRHADHRATTVVARQVPPLELGRVGTAAAVGAVALPVVVIVGGPVATLLYRLAGGSRYAPDLADLLPAARTTLLLGIATAVLATAVALPIASLGARYRYRWIRLVEGVSYLGQALPSVIIALAVVFMSIRIVPSAYQQLPLLLFAYVIIFFPKAIGSARSAIQQVSPILGETARTLGRSAWRVGWSITLRQAWPGIASGAVLVMAATMKEVPLTLMIRPIGLQTLATELWSKTSIDAYGAAAPAALALIVVGLAPAWLLSRASRP